MADTPILALDINDEAIFGILFTEEKRLVSVIASHCCFRKDQANLADALKDVVEHCRGQFARCQVSFGAENFHYRTLHLPFADLKKVRSILPFEIQDSVSFADDQFIYDYLLEPNNDEGTDVLVALLQKDLLREWLELLSEYDLDPEVITISGLPAAYNLCRFRQDRADSFVLLDVGFRKASLFLVFDDQVRALRSLTYDAERQAGFTYSTEKEKVRAENPQQLAIVLKRLAGEVDNTLFALKAGQQEYQDFPIYLGGSVGREPEYAAMILESLGVSESEYSRLPFAEPGNLDMVTEQWPGGIADNALALACSSTKDKGRINFRKDEFTRLGSGWDVSRSLKVGAMGLLGLFLVIVLYQAFDYQKMQRQRRMLTVQVADVYKETVIGSIPGRDPVRELQVKVNELKETAAVGSAHDPSITTVTLLADISARIPVSMQVTFERYIYDRKTIRVKGLTDNFNTVDQMKRALGKSPYFSNVSIGSANIAPKGQGVRFELKLEL